MMVVEGGAEGTRCVYCITPGFVKASAQYKLPPLVEEGRKYDA